MKKLLIIAAALFIGVGASAQTNWYVGGALGVAGVSTSHNSETGFTVAPEVGCSFNDTWGAGLAISWAKVSGLSSSDFALKPYARLNCASLGDRVNFFVDGIVPIIFNYSGNDKVGCGITLAPGVAFSMSDKVALVAHVGEFGFIACDKVTTWQAGVNANNISLGFYFCF